MQQTHTARADIYAFTKHEAAKKKKNWSVSVRALQWKNKTRGREKFVRKLCVKRDLMGGGASLI